MSEKLRILIVEDEAITAENLKETLLFLGYEVVGIASNSIEAIGFLSNEKVDLTILDIHIQGDKNGIWVANYIRKSHKIPFIFLTAYGDEKTLIDATSTRPYGYLLKPFTQRNLLASLQIALINFTEDSSSDYKNATTQTEENKDILKKENVLYVKHKGAYVKLFLDDIYFLESNKNYIQIYLMDDKYIVRSTLKEFANLLSDNYIQIHRSFIIDYKKVDVIKNDSVFIGPYKVPIGSSDYKEKLFSLIKTL